LACWSRYDLIAIDEVGYVPLAEVGAEFLFQIVAERAEKAAVVLTTNLPFSEWTQVIPNGRLCKALRRSSSHPGDGHRILSLPPNRGKTKEGSQAAMTPAKLWK
jgi:hypothetical protein